MESVPQPHCSQFCYIALGQGLTVRKLFIQLRWAGTLECEIGKEKEEYLRMEEMQCLLFAYNTPASYTHSHWASCQRWKCFISFGLWVWRLRISLGLWPAPAMELIRAPPGIWIQVSQASKLSSSHWSSLGMCSWLWWGVGFPQIHNCLHAH